MILAKKSAQDVLDDLINLGQFISKDSPTTKLVISAIITRTDDPNLKVRSHGATNRRDMLQGHFAGSNFIVCHRSKPCRGGQKIVKSIDFMQHVAGTNLLQRLVASCELFRS